MIAVRITLATFVFALTALWLAAGTGTPTAGQTLQPMITQYTGTMALALMSLAMVLATRPKWLERPLNGLDRMYRLHRWLGITGLGFLLVHWWVSSGEQLRRRRAWTEEPAEGLHSWLQKQEGIAEAVSEWSFYAIVTLLILALVRWFPYHLFQKTHRLLAVAYVFIVYHSLVLLRFDYWSQPIGWVTAALMLAGLIATIIVLTGRIGHSRKVKGTVESLAFYSRLQVLEGTVNLEDGWPGHNPGQFAFIKDEKREGAHPYTIASDWMPEQHCLTFFVRGKHLVLRPSGIRPKPQARPCRSWAKKTGLPSGTVPNALSPDAV